MHLITGPHYSALTTVPQEMPVLGDVSFAYGSDAKCHELCGRVDNVRRMYLSCVYTLAKGGVTYRFYFLRWSLVSE